MLIALAILCVVIGIAVFVFNNWAAGPSSSSEADAMRRRANWYLLGWIVVALLLLIWHWS